METQTSAFLPSLGFEADFEEECRRKGIRILRTLGRWAETTRFQEPLLFCKQFYPDVFEMPYSSNQEILKTLKKHNLRWTSFAHALHRKSSILQKELKYFKKTKMELDPLPTYKPMGSYLLVDDKKFIFTPKIHYLFPEDAEIEFIENKKDPPSRAYLKLWEAWVRFSRVPKKDEFCIDLGSSPGGWSWALSRYSKHVLSVDRAPLAQNLQNIQNISFLKKDAFKLKPKEILDQYGTPDWVCSDIICYPEKLYDLFLEWDEAYPNAAFLLTVKLQGKTNFEVLERFQSIEGAKLFHLSHNKHEMTFFRDSKALPQKKEQV